MAINISVEAPDLDVTAVQRQQGMLTEQTLQQFVAPRSSGVSADAAFTFGTRAARPASGLGGDRYFATDRNTLYAYSGTAWVVVVGFFAGTDATRSGWTIDATDDNSFFYTTDTGKLWEVVSGAWVDRFTTLTLTTSLKVGANQVLNARKTGWGSPAGTLSRSAYTSYAGQAVSAAYVQAEAQATDDAVKLLSRVVAALLTDLHSATSGHGLLGT